MADNLEKNNLGELFSALPENIRRWLASEELVFIISEIEDKLGLDGEKILVIPRLILRFVVQDIEPQDFIGELSRGLGVDFFVAKTITEDIEKNALRPIAAELRDKLGLEVKLIYYGKAGGEKSAEQVIAPAGKISTMPASLPPSEISQAAPSVSGAAQPDLSRMTPPAQLSQARPMSPLTFTATPSAGSAGQVPLQPEKKVMTPPIITAAPVSQPISQRKEEAMPESAVPFILHQESSPTSAPSLNQKPQGASLPKTSLTMKVQNYFQSAGTPERTISKPISIKIEAPAAQQAAAQTEKMIPIAKQPAPAVSRPEVAPVIPQAPIMAAGQIKQPEQARVVHYSNLRTPIDNLGLPKKEVDKSNVVDLRKFM